MNLVHNFELIGSPITQLSVAHLSSLESLNLSGCQLTSLDLRGLTRLLEVQVKDNSLRDILLEKNLALNSLDLENNALKTLGRDDGGKHYRVPITDAELAAFFQTLDQGAQVVMEASTSSFRFSEMLSEHAGRVVVSDPAQTRGALSKSLVNDNKAAETLARLLRSNLAPEYKDGSNNHPVVEFSLNLRDDHRAVKDITQPGWRESRWPICRANFCPTARAGQASQRPPLVGFLKHRDFSGEA